MGKAEVHDTATVEESAQPALDQSRAFVRARKPQSPHQSKRKEQTRPCQAHVRRQVSGPGHPHHRRVCQQWVPRKDSMTSDAEVRASLTETLSPIAAPAQQNFIRRLAPQSPSNGVQPSISIT